MKIYIAGPLSSSSPQCRRSNIDQAMDAGIALYQTGHSPYLPHLTAFLDERQQNQGKTLGYEDWLRVDLDWLALCDGLLFLGSSPGADRELAFARERGLQIFYSLKEVPVVLTVDAFGVGAN